MHDTEQEPLLRLYTHLLDDALRLAESLEDVIDDAPLNQRVHALSQLIDKIIKLAAVLPRPAEAERVIRHEYRYADGTIHPTPPWADEDYTE